MRDNEGCGNDEIFYLIHGGYFVKIIWAVFLFLIKKNNHVLL
jgi:hypothetical protein